MIKIEEKNKCCGCHACFNICPKNAIEMIEDEKGFKLRIINNSFQEAKGGWALVTFKSKHVIGKFDRLKDAKAYAETL